MERKKLVSYVIASAIAVGLLQQSLYFRWIGYESIPSPTVTDEYNYIWQAESLKQTGLPMAWVTFSDIYKNEQLDSRGGDLKNFGIVVNSKLIDLQAFKKDSRPLFSISTINYNKGKEYMFFAAPFFDHPPLGGLIYSLGIPKEVKTVEQVKPADFRKPALWLAAITTGLIFIFTLMITGNPWMGLAAVAVYATVPTYLLGTRAAYLENVVPPFVLGHLILTMTGKILTDKHKTREGLIIFGLAGFMGGLAILAKEPAVGFILGSIIVLIINKAGIKQLGWVIGGVCVPVLGYIGWGLWLQKDIFIKVFLSNSSRQFFGSLKFATMLEALRFKNFPVDGWWIWGFISFLLVSLKLNKNSQRLFLVVPLATHFMTVMLLASYNYPWYYLAMIPFLAICSGLIIWELIFAPSLPVLLAFFMLPISSAFYWGFSVFHLTNSVQTYRLFFFGVTFFGLVSLFIQKNKFAKLAWYGFMAIVLFEAYKWNQRSIQFMVANWGNLPVPSLPNF